MKTAVHLAPGTTYLVYLPVDLAGVLVRWLLVDIAQVVSLRKSTTRQNEVNINDETISVPYAVQSRVNLQITGMMDLQGRWTT